MNGEEFDEKFRPIKNPHEPEWEKDIRLCKGMAKLLDRVEQEQVVTY